MYERELMYSPPSGLCACRLGDDELHIAAISPCSVTVRLPAGKNICGRLALYLYIPEQGIYESYILQNYTGGEAQHLSDAVLFRLCFDDPACANAIRRMMNSYARYLEIKSTLGASAYADIIAGYPSEQDEIFLPTLQAQKIAWFSDFPAIPEPGKGISLAVELNSRTLQQMYLNLPFPEFMRAYARLHSLSPDALPKRLPDRIYVGSSYCRHIFPSAEQLHQIAAKAKRENLALTLMTAGLYSNDTHTADFLIAFASAHSAELLINDWGMLHRAAGKCQILLGPLLNRRRKDPRFSCKPGLNESLLAQNSLNDAAWLKYLSDMGVSSYAYDASPVPADLPNAPCSLHLPFYQTNTSRWCPLQAICTHGNRGSQRPSAECEGLCEENALIYPAHLKMIGRWNSIFALNDQIDPADMARFDRWILNF